MNDAVLIRNFRGSDQQLLEMLADQLALIYEHAQLKQRAATKAET